MRAKLGVTVLAGAVLFLGACDLSDVHVADAERFHRDFHYSHDLAANGRLVAETFNGSVEISGWDQNRIDISGTKYGRTQQEADELKVSVDSAPDSVSIHVIRPTDRRNNQGARLVLKVPRGVLLDRITTSNGAIRTSEGVGPARLKTSNGPISVSHLRGPLDAQTSNAPLELLDIDGDLVAHTSNGRIQVERLNGNLEATTSNSAVHADFVRSDCAVRVETSNGPVELSSTEGFSREVRASTNNSPITLRVPMLNAHILARTSNSAISSDFDLHVQGEITKNHLDATIGSGGALLDLVTSNGPIRIARM